MTDYNILNKPGRKKMLLSFCLVFWWLLRSFILIVQEWMTLHH